MEGGDLPIHVVDLHPAARAQNKPLSKEFHPGIWQKTAVRLVPLRLDMPSCKPVLQEHSGPFPTNHHEE